MTTRRQIVNHEYPAIRTSLCHITNFVCFLYDVIPTVDTRSTYWHSYGPVEDSLEILHKINTGNSDVCFRKRKNSVIYRTSQQDTQFWTCQLGVSKLTQSHNITFHYKHQPALFNQPRHTTYHINHKCASITQHTINLLHRGLIWLTLSWILHSSVFLQIKKSTSPTPPNIFNTTRITLTVSTYWQLCF